jgi:hypothetical protein
MVLSGYRIVLLKILSSEMDQTESGLTRKALIKGRGTGIFRKFALPPRFESPLKF